VVAKVLLVDDEPNLLHTLRYSLRQAGYEVVTAVTGEEALAQARGERPDVVVLDVMLPGLDGFEVCRRLRGESSVPILMLTARTDEVDRVVGLEVGADDYLTKPFSQRELVARLKAMLRRRELLRQELAEGPPNAESLASDDLHVDVRGHRAQLGGRPVALKPKEFDLLTFLMRHRGQVFSAEQLLERVWGYADTSDPRTVPVHIRTLREKLEADPSRPTRIETVRGVGYRFVG
jgi:DNA-binding response OmpR family regulator